MGRAALERGIGRGLAAAGALAVALLTLRPDPSQQALSAETPLLCLVCGDKGGVDVFLNLLLFMPIGAGLRLAGWRWRRVVAAAALGSFAVELLQFTVVTGRDASLSDLVTNTAGAAVAAALAPLWRSVLLPTPGRAVRFYVAWAAVWLGILLFTVWLQHPRSLRGPLVNVWPEQASVESAFTGRVIAVAVNGAAMPREEKPPGRAAIRHALDRGAAALDLTAISGPPTTDLVFLYSLRVRRTPLLGIAQYGRDAVLVVPSRAQRLRIWSPTLQLRDAFPPDSGTPVALHGEVRDGRLWLSSRWAGSAQETSMVLRPTLGWATVPPIKFVLGRKVRLLTALWVGALVLPLGYWAAAFGRPAAGAGAVAAALGAGLGLLPALIEGPQTHWSEWTAGGLGAAVGWALFRLAAYLQGRCASPSISGSSSS